MRHYAAQIGLLAVLLLSACQRATIEEKAAQDARDVAYVDAVQAMRPPVRPLRLQPMSGAAHAVYRLGEVGCAFRADPGGHEPVFVAGRARAVVMLGGEPAIFAADSGSAELALGIREKYVGRTHWALLTRAPDTLTIRDRFERIVYAAGGTLRCGAPPER